MTELRKVLTARQIFRLEFGDSKNFMTPEILWCVKASPSVAVELSEGAGFDGERIFGLTAVCLKSDGTTRRGRGSSKCFHSRARATARFERIQSILTTKGAK